ncbi:hypothetical protein HMPREF1548_06740 [Clostridium sp. KLE 1755]|nr:hypothetical protein HMPREF1548_06740 [Clostridium sp. KLE 1755]
MHNYLHSYREAFQSSSCFYYKGIISEIAGHFLSEHFLTF